MRGLRCRVGGKEGGLLHGRIGRRGRFVRGFAVGRIEGRGVDGGVHGRLALGRMLCRIETGRLCRIVSGMASGLSFCWMPRGFALCGSR